MQNLTNKTESIVKRSQLYLFNGTQLSTHTIAQTQNKMSEVSHDEDICYDEH